MARKLIVEIIGDSASLERAYARSTAAGDRFGKSLGFTSKQGQAMQVQFAGLGRSIAAGAGFIGAAVAAEKLGEALRTGVSNAAQLTNASQAINAQFGDAAGKVKAFAQNATELGISAVQSEQLSARLGILIQNLGIGHDKAAEMTIGLQELAGAIAEIKGVSFESVAQNLPQALAGNLRSLKQLGFAFSQAQIKAEAIKEGLIGVNDALTPGAKAQAIYALATKNLSGFLDQAKASSSDLTNQTHILDARISNLETNMGKLVTGPLTGLVAGLADATDGALKLFGAIGKLSGVTGSLGKKLSGSDFGRGFIAAISPAASLLGLLKSINHEADHLSNAKPAQAFLDAIAQIRRDAAGGSSDIGRRAAQPLRNQNITAAQRNQFFDAAVGRAQDLVQDQKTVQAQIQALQAIAAKIQQRLNVTKDVTRRLTLEGRLRDVFRQIAADRQQLAQDLHDALVAGNQEIVDALNLRLEEAQASGNLKAQLRDLILIQDAIRNRIREEGKTTDLLRQLFEAQQQQKQLLAQQREAREFRRLGLGPTGDPLIPSAKNLLKQLESLSLRIAGTKLDTSKLRKQLEQIRKVLTDPIDKATRDVREKIAEMFDAIRQSLNQGTQKGPLTPTHGLNTKQIVEGLGLSADQIRDLRARLSHFNTAGRALGGTGSSTATVALPGGGFEVVNDIKIFLDGKQLEGVVTKRQQIRKRRNPPQRRGHR